MYISMYELYVVVSRYIHVYVVGNRYMANNVTQMNGNQIASAIWRAVLRTITRLIPGYSNPSLFQAYINPLK